MPDRRLCLGLVYLHRSHCRMLLLPHLQCSESSHLLQHLSRYWVMMGSHLPLLLTGLSGRSLTLGRCLFNVRCALLLSPDHRSALLDEELERESYRCQWDSPSGYGVLCSAIYPPTSVVVLVPSFSRHTRSSQQESPMGTNRCVTSVHEAVRLEESILCCIPHQDQISPQYGMVHAMVWITCGTVPSLLEETEQVFNHQF